MPFIRPPINPDAPPAFANPTPVNTAPTSRQPIIANAFLPTDTGQLVAPKVSWLLWQCAAIMEEDDRLALLVPLSGTVTTSPGGAAEALGQVKALRDNLTPPGATVISSVDNIIQRVSGPVHKISLVGRALRLGYPIAPRPAWAPSAARRPCSAAAGS